MFIPGFLPIDFLLNGLFGSVLAMLFIPSMITFGLNTFSSILQMFFPGAAPVVM